MPIKIENDFTSVSLKDLVELRARGYSVLKSPHVGNQHPSNLVCAALGLPLEMVSFTIPERDKNFHPQLQIVAGEGTQLFDPGILTQFACVPGGQTATEFHQSAVQRVFPRTEICTDIERMLSENTLSEIVLRRSNQAIKQLWYRKVDGEGNLQSVRRVERLLPSALEGNIFQVTNQSAGWVVPNRVHAVFDFIWQSLSSGRDVIYHLSGPQMVGYIGGIKSSISTIYDAVREEVPGLPETLTLRVVPVAACRFVTLRSRADALLSVQEVVGWYETLPNQECRHAHTRFREVVEMYPEFTTAIETAATLSQYDIASADDLLLDPWMIKTPLSRVESMYKRLLKAASALSSETA